MKLRTRRRHAQRAQLALMWRRTAARLSNWDDWGTLTGGALTDPLPAAFDPTRVDRSHAILVGHVVKVCNLMTWARWFEALWGKGLHVGDDAVGGLRVSTVFLGVDMSHGFGPPLWFETMVFGGALDGLRQRYTTWAQAEAGHTFVVKLARAEAALVREHVAAELQRIARL